MLDCPDLAVPRDVMQHVVRVESSRNPFAIGVVGGRLARQPRSLDEALATVELLRTEGYNFSVGIAQVNRYNLAPYGLKNYAQAFDVCANLQAGARILRECYDRAQDWGKAFSCYYSGNFVTGFDHGYVQKVFDSIREATHAGSPVPPNAIAVIARNGTPRQRARDEHLPLRATADPAAQAAAPPISASAPYPEPYAVRRYLPSTPLEVTAAARMLAGRSGHDMDTTESRPAIPVPGPGAVMPGQSAAPIDIRSQIPVQVVGVDGNPYRTRMLPPTANLPGEALPRPDPGQAADARKPVSRVVERRGGPIVLSSESSASSENPGARSSPVAGDPPGPTGDSPSDRSFVF